MAEEAVIEDEGIEEEIPEDEGQPSGDDYTQEELAAAEKIAAKIGYNKDYDGPNKRTAVEFILASRDIQEQTSKALKEKLKHIDALKEDVSKVVDFVKTQEQQRSAGKITELENRIKDLQEKRKEFILEGDLDKVTETEKTISETASEIHGHRVASQPAPAGPSAFDKLMAEWNDSNKWYGTDRAMTAFANTIKTDPAVQGMDDKQYLAFVESEVKKEFAHKFKKTTPPQSVAGSGDVRRGNSAPARENPEAKLTRQQRSILDDYERMGILKSASDRMAYATEMVKNA